MSSSSEWREYQQKTGDFFRRLGLTASIEARLEGARGVHVIDVYVEGTYHGIAFKWIIECKAWAGNISKEKVMALAAIVQDVGVDRGFLLSEKGFQSGAVRAARKTNITLTSLADLSESTEEHFVDAAIGALNWRRAKASTRLREIFDQKYEEIFMAPTLGPAPELMVLESMLQDAARGEYPIVYDQGRKKLETLDALLAYADAVISAAERWTPPD